MSSGPCEAQVMKRDGVLCNALVGRGWGGLNMSLNHRVVVFFLCIVAAEHVLSKWTHQSVGSTFHCSVNTMLNCKTTLQFSSEKSFSSPSITELTSAAQIYRQEAKSDGSFWEGKGKKKEWPEGFSTFHNVPNTLLAYQKSSQNHLLREERAAVCDQKATFNYRTGRRDTSSNSYVNQDFWG